MDFVERALLNHVAANIGREPGEYGYFLALGSVATKVWSTPFDSWWCCFGTGMESPTRYNEHIYSVHGDTVHVNLFIASELRWSDVTLRQETRFPEEEVVRFSVASPRPVRLELRQPSWCGVIRTSYELKDGDRVEVRLPMRERLEPLPHSDGKIAAVMKGPMVMAGLVPGAAPDQERYVDHLKARGKTDDLPPVMVEGSSKPYAVNFVPLYRVYEEPYAVYFPLLSASEWREREASIRAEQERRRRIEAATLDIVEPGFQQSEVEHNLRCERSQTGDLHGRKFREGDWFSYEMAVDPAQPVMLMATCWGSQWAKREFDILIDGTAIARQVLPTHNSGEFVDLSYVIPSALTSGKERAVVRLQGSVPQVFGLKTVRAVGLTDARREG